MMKTANKIVMTLCGLLLLFAAVMKFNQLLTEPIITERFWETRPFLIAHVPFEIALGICLLSGLFRKAGWLVGLVTFAF
ncbi:unnamed protein product, partial [marine sediment metagenome]